MTTPILTTISILSNNSNGTIAGKFDDIILKFTADQPISIPIVTINGNSADSITNTTNNEWTAFRKAKAEDTEGIVPFTIDFSNLTAEAGVQVINTSDNSSVTYDESTVTISKFADTDRVYKDMGKTRGSNDNRDNLVVRSDEDASSELQAVFLNLVDFDDLPSWFIDLSTKLTTAIFWAKSNGSSEQLQAVKDIISDSKQIREARFHPTEYR